MTATTVQVAAVADGVLMPKLQVVDGAQVTMLEAVPLSIGGLAVIAV